MMILLKLTRSELLRYSFGLVALSALLLVAWPGLLRNLFATETASGMFMPHFECYYKVPSLVFLHLTSDFLIGISYVAISLTLAYLVHHARRDIPFHWIFLAFGLFIIACGATHFMEVWTMWNATYWLSGYVKLITAAASIATAIILPPLIPRALSLVETAKVSDERRANIERANEQLAREIAERKVIEDELREAKEELEIRVAERTTELSIANEQLQQELARTRHAEDEQARLREEIIWVQQGMLAELSTPLIPIGEHIVVMPLIGTIDEGRAERVMQILADGVVEQGARVAIIDITGVAQVDTHVAHTLIQVAQAVRLLGAEVVLTGIRSSVAQTIVSLGLDFSMLTTRSTLYSGLDYAREYLGAKGINRRRPDRR